MGCEAIVKLRAVGETIASRTHDFPVQGIGFETTACAGSIAVDFPVSLRRSWLMACRDRCGVFLLRLFLAPSEFPVRLNVLV